MSNGAKEMKEVFMYIWRLKLAHMKLWLSLLLQSLYFRWENKIHHTHGPVDQDLCWRKMCSVLCGKSYGQSEVVSFLLSAGIFTTTLSLWWAVGAHEPAQR